MKDRTEQLNNVTSVGAGQSAACMLPLENRIYNTVDFVIEHDALNDGNIVPMTKAQMIAKIEHARVYVSGERIWDIDPASLFAAYEDDGYPAFVDGYFTFHFEQPNLDTITARGFTSLGTAGVDPVKGIRLEVKLKTDVIAPSIRAVAHYDDGIQRPNNVIKYKTNTIDITQTGKHNHKLESPAESYSAIYLIEQAAGDVAGLELKWSNSVAHEVLAKDLEVKNKRMGYTPQAGVVALHLDARDPSTPMPTGRINSVTGDIVAVQKILRIDMAVANPLTIVEKMIGAVMGA